MLELTGRRALVTGASSGIGQAIAESLAGMGATVIVAGRDVERAREVASGLPGGEVAVADLATVDGVEDLARQALDGGPVDILVNNAGVFPFLPTAHIDASLFTSVFDINVRAPFLLTRALIPSMSQRQFGRVINVSSISAQVASPGSSLYGASKAALEALTRGWTAEFGSDGVTINTIAPGPTLTPGTEPLAAGLTALTASFPVGRPASVTEIAAIAAFLAGPNASYLSGATINVDGGGVASRR